MRADCDDNITTKVNFAAPFEMETTDQLLFAEDELVRTICVRKSSIEKVLSFVSAQRVTNGKKKAGHAVTAQPAIYVHSR